MSKLYNILDKITPKDSLHFCEQKKLVWTNPNPSASFGAQTITADVLTNDTVEIIYTDDGLTYRNDYQHSGKLIGVGGSTYPTELWDRKLTVNNGSITFTAAYYQKVGASGTGSNNARLVPKEIYVIKKLGE